MSARKCDPFFVEKSSKNCKKRVNIPTTVDRHATKSDTAQIPDPEKKTKRPFDKKQYRLKKYSTEYKMKKWEQTRKKKMMYKYHKELKNTDQGFDVKKIYAEVDEDSGSEPTHFPEDAPEKHESDETFSNISRKINKNKKLNDKFKNGKGIDKEDLTLKRGIQKEELKNVHSRIEKPKKRFRKTKKGQPIMKERLEDMFEKIQKSIMNEKDQRSTFAHD